MEEEQEGRGAKDERGDIGRRSREEEGVGVERRMRRRRRRRRRKRGVLERSWTVWEASWTVLEASSYSLGLQGGLKVRVPPSV